MSCKRSVPEPSLWFCWCSYVFHPLLAGGKPQAWLLKHAARSVRAGVFVCVCARLCRRVCLCLCLLACLPACLPCFALPCLALPCLALPCLACLLACFVLVCCFSCLLVFCLIVWCARLRAFVPLLWMLGGLHLGPRWTSAIIPILAGLVYLSICVFLAGASTKLGNSLRPAEDHLPLKRPQ